MQGQRCGRMIDTAIPTDMPPTALCRSLAVRLALEQPRWSPQLHSDFPQRFKVPSDEKPGFFLCCGALHSTKQSCYVERW